MTSPIPSYIASHFYILSNTRETLNMTSPIPSYITPHFFTFSNTRELLNMISLTSSYITPHFYTLSNTPSRNRYALTPSFSKSGLLVFLQNSLCCAIDLLSAFTLPLGATRAGLCLTCGCSEAPWPVRQHEGACLLIEEGESHGQRVTCL